MLISHTIKDSVLDIWYIDEREVLVCRGGINCFISLYKCKTLITEVKNLLEKYSSNRNNVLMK